MNRYPGRSAVGKAAGIPICALALLGILPFAVSPRRTLSDRTACRAEHECPGETGPDGGLREGEVGGAQPGPDQGEQESEDDEEDDAAPRLTADERGDREAEQGGRKQQIEGEQERVQRVSSPSPRSARLAIRCAPAALASIASSQMSTSVTPVDRPGA